MAEAADFTEAVVEKADNHESGVWPIASCRYRLRLGNGWYALVNESIVNGHRALVYAHIEDPLDTLQRASYSSYWWLPPDPVPSGSRADMFIGRYVETAGLGGRLLRILNLGNYLFPHLSLNTPPHAGRAGGGEGMWNPFPCLLFA